MNYCMSTNNPPRNGLKASMPWSELQMFSLLTEMSDTSQRLPRLCDNGTEHRGEVKGKKKDVCWKWDFNHCWEAVATGLTKTVLNRRNQAVNPVKSKQGEAIDWSLFLKWFWLFSVSHKKSGELTNKWFPRIFSYITYIYTENKSQTSKPLHPK